MMEVLLDYKVVTDDIEVQYEVYPMYDEADLADPRKHRIIDELNAVDEQMSVNRQKIDVFNNEIDRIANHADGLDNMVAVGSGILSGLIDSFWVGKFDFKRGNEWSDKQVNSFVTNIAKKHGYKGDDLEGAIKYLESGAKHKNLDIRGFGTPSDSIIDKFGGGLQHHLRDFAHHPTPVGLAFSILTQFTRRSYGTDKYGIFKIEKVTNEAFIGKDIPQKFLFGIVFWFFHMLSDIAGTSINPGAGTGLPGPILSLLKELSALPFFNSLKNEDDVKAFSLWISKLFNGTLLAERDVNGKIIKESAELMRFDFRAELGAAYELGRQALPVILNECIVRGFYFIRRLTAEIKEKEVKRISELKRIDWDKVKPTKNRTVIRMLTIAHGTFTAIDLADAAIRGVIEAGKTGGNVAMFAKEFIIRVNFVGVGRFAIAAGIDTAMGVKSSKLRNERLAVYSEQLQLMNAKVYYMQANTWIAAETAEQTINGAIEEMERTILIFFDSLSEIETRMQNVDKQIALIQAVNPNFIKEIDEVLIWE